MKFHDAKTISTRELVLDLWDKLTNGIKYDRKTDRYILVWTKRELYIARRKASRLRKLFDKREAKP